MASVASDLVLKHYGKACLIGLSGVIFYKYITSPKITSTDLKKLIEEKGKNFQFNEFVRFSPDAYELIRDKDLNFSRTFSLTLSLPDITTKTISLTLSLPLSFPDITKRQ